MSSTFCPHSASLVKIKVHPWWRVEHLHSGDGFTQLRMCVPGQSSPRTAPSLLQTSVDHLSHFWGFFYYDVLVRYMVHLVPQRRASIAQGQFGQLGGWEKEAAAQ